MSRWTLWRLKLLVPLLLLALAAGCGSGRYPVSGHVTYEEDGSPLQAGIVIGEATVDDKSVSVQGNIAKDGSFHWGTERPGDGALPGTYRVIVQPVALGEIERAEGKLPDVEDKYTKFETSGITYEVKPEKNVLNITVTRPKRKAK